MKTAESERISSLSKDDAKTLGAGDQHYTSYVGWPGQYDYMGATQFRLLTTLGLRDHHALLDFGCGSLRAGRLFIPYLNVGGYHGIEPNQWLVKEGIDREIGEDIVALKQPSFVYSEACEVSKFGKRFDYVIAQSIFSHTGLALASEWVGKIASVLNDDGLFVVTFVDGISDSEEEGWIYPGIVQYRPRTIRSMFAKHGLFAVGIPWYHPRQNWYVCSKRRDRLPPRRYFRHLGGAVLLDSEFRASCNRLGYLMNKYKKRFYSAKDAFPQWAVRFGKYLERR